MSLPPVYFPFEVWNHIFGYLSATDKFCVRASCKYFKKLIDHSSLWKNWTAVLSFRNRSYSSGFWDSLRRRKVSSVVMRSSKAKDWNHLSLALPSITTVVMEQNSPGSMNFIKDFPHVNRLAVRSGVLLLDIHMKTQLQQLTHLSLCDVTFPIKPDLSFFYLMPYLSNLKSMVCHKSKIFGRERMIDTFVTILPKLKHLSLSAEYIHPQNEGLSSKPVTSLFSLELIDCMHHSSLPEDTIKMIHHLKSLTIFYKHSHQEVPEGSSTSAFHLQTWLREFTQLSNLVVVKGPPLKMYVTSIPATVTSLTLCVAGLSSKDLKAVAVQVPDLLHLHIDPWPSHLGAHTAQIPVLFPKLKSLKLRHEHVPEKDFLSLHQLKDLEYLEVLDKGPHLSDLANKLRILTKDRLEVATCPPQRDVLLCSCVCQVY